jgi:hypothetical protein
VPFNIDARLNGAFVALGLVYGGGDFAKTLDVSTRAGQDSDCNPSSAAGILGVMLGYDRIPNVWKAGIARLSTTKFAYTSYSFVDITRSTLARALRVIESAGGRVTPTEVFVPLQEPKAPPLEQWAVDPPRARLETNDAAWAWGAGWSEKKAKERDRERTDREAAAPGAEATLKFTGTGVTVVGECGQDGGRADVFLDGQKVLDIDAYIVPRTNDNDLWHVTGIAGGEHTLRIVTRADHDERSSGGRVTVEAAIVYGPQ